jgi:hypothetical protein
VSATYSGNYPIEHRAGEIERLNIQSKAMAPDTLTMLDRFGPIEAGNGDAFSRRVDADIRFSDYIAGIAADKI